MPTLKVRPQICELVMSVRFVQGYRFLDSCGDAIIQLENALEEHWIPGEIKPTGGVMRNYAMGLLAKFDSEQLTVAQSDFIDFGVFADQTIKIYETLWRLFRIDKILSPAFRVDIQAGFSKQQHAEQYIQELGLVTPGDRINVELGGNLTAIQSVICTEMTTRRFDHDLTIRRRLAGKAITQTKQPDFDSRVMARTNLLSLKQRAAVEGLLELRRKHVASVSDAAQISFEETLEGEIETRAFSMHEFLQVIWQRVAEILPRYNLEFEVQ